jgi:hypothetical protein
MAKAKHMTARFLQQATGDTTMIFLFHLGLLALVLYAIWGSHKMKQDEVYVKRGEEGWDRLALVYGILSVVVTQIISLSEGGKGHKVFITLIDLATLLYLSFYNSWFRNKIIRFIGISRNMQEGK